jgi:hypothetical protein
MCLGFDRQHIELLSAEVAFRVQGLTSGRLYVPSFVDLNDADRQAATVTSE